MMLVFPHPRLPILLPSLLVALLLKEKGFTGEGRSQGQSGMRETNTRDRIV